LKLPADPPIGLFLPVLTFWRTDPYELRTHTVRS